MSFASKLEAGQFPVALEITPPQASKPRVLFRRAALLGEAASAVNVIQRPDRQPSLDAAAELTAQGVPAVWHLATRGRTRGELESDLARARAALVPQVLCLLGDHGTPGGGAGPVTIRETIVLARELLPDALIGATLNQYVPDHDTVLKNLFPKLAAGAGYVQTQPVFAADGLDRLLERLDAAFPEVFVVPMVMPVPSLAVAGRMSERLGVPLPASLLRGLEQGRDPMDAFAEEVAGLVAHPAIDGIAIMTFEVDPSPETGAALVAALRAARAVG